jgi:c-di-GMP-binding flagellar brake protein YcgR
MRELIEKDAKITIVPHNFKNATKGKITDIYPEGFTVELDYDPEGFLINNYCEFYTQNRYGTVFFSSYPKKIEGRTLKIANPAKHKFLQRRQYRRIKFINDITMKCGENDYQITTLDVSAGGMKLKTNENIDIEKEYSLTLPLSAEQSVDAVFAPIRIEKAGGQMGIGAGYILSGQFTFKNQHDKMTMTQYCAKRSIEIRNK